MQSYYVGLALSIDPNSGNEDVAWEQYADGNRKVMNFGDIDITKNNTGTTWEWI
jgi:hypothetical protein